VFTEVNKKVTQAGQDRHMESKFSVIELLEVVDKAFGSHKTLLNDDEADKKDDPNKFFKDRFFPEREVRSVRNVSDCGLCIKDYKFRFKMWSAGYKKWFNPWGSFDEIEARYGSSVASYFYFAQYMFWFNVLLTTSSLFVVVVGIMNFDWDMSTYEILNQTYVGLLTGDGIAYSWLFYGNYYDESYYGSDEKNGYDMDLAWIMYCVALLIISLAVTLSEVDSKAFADAEDLDNQEGSMETCEMLYATFDFGIREDKACNIQRIRMKTQFMDLIKEKV